MTIHEALGLTFSQILDSSYTLIEAMMQEYAYICNERNRRIKGEEVGPGEEWITFPDFETGKMKRIKKGKM